MKVLKFGGTSVGTVESLCNVKKIIESESQEPLIVVVSALEIGRAHEWQQPEIQPI